MAELPGTLTIAWSLVKLDPALDIQWQRYYGTGSNFDIQGLAQGADGSFAAGGCRTPTSGSIWYWDVYRDAFVMKVGPDGAVGVPGSEFIGQSDAVFTDTEAVPGQATAIFPLTGFVSSQLVTGSSIDVAPQQGDPQLEWPPAAALPDRDERDEPRSLQGRGDQHPALGSEPLEQPVRDRLLCGLSAAGQRQHGLPEDGNGSANATAYVDQGLGFDDMYAYAVRAVDAEGNESPISQVARN